MADLLARAQLRHAILHGRGPKRLKRPAKWLRPRAAEVAYSEALVGLVDRLAAAVRTHLLSLLPSLVRSAGAHRDAWDDDLQGILLRVKTALRETGPTPASLAQEIGARASTWNLSQWRRIVRSAVGVDLFVSEPWLAPKLRSWARENAQLITSLEEDALGQVATWTQRGIRQGWRWEDIATALEDRYEVSRGRARFIARDQVATLNSELTQERQTQAGVSEYEWSTSKDERVRGAPRNGIGGKYPSAVPSHVAREGKVFKWADAPEGGHPGIAPNCRCVAVPRLEGLLEGLG